MLVIHTPGHMFKTKWQVALYLDQRATAAQAEALGKIFSGQAGGHLAHAAPLIGQVLGVKTAVIEYEAKTLGLFQVPELRPVTQEVEQAIQAMMADSVLMLA